ncbi:hypothetical protein M3Y97_00487600 [Aphelenchoides bicaudatus]|nr:hypothetical protein M3Y97_00487600 [Aphelenchoides bicaudatus]
MPPNWGALIFLFFLILPTIFADGTLGKLHTSNELCNRSHPAFNRTVLINDIYNCSDHGLDCTDVTNKAPYILLKNIMNTMKEIDENTHLAFRRAVSQLIGRIESRNSLLFSKMIDSTEKFNLFNSGNYCVVKEQVCRQNQLYLYPMFCTAREHLFDFDPKLNYTQLLRLYYGVAYAFQMINAEVNSSLECNRLYDVQPIYFKQKGQITGNIMLDEKRLCKYYNDYYYDLGAQTDNSKFKECQNGKSEQLARFSRKIDIFMENCANGVIKALSEDNL